MAKRPDVSLEKPNRVLGIVAAIVVAWALLVPLPLLVSFADHLWWQPGWARQVPFHWPSFGEAVAIVVLMGVVGLPLSMVFCFAVGLPAWLIASGHGLRRPRDAAVVGALVGLVLDLLLGLLKLASLTFVLPQPHEPLSRVVFLYPCIGVYVAAVGAVAGLAARWISGTQSLDRRDMAQLFA